MSWLLLYYFFVIFLFVYLITREANTLNTNNNFKRANKILERETVVLPEVEKSDHIPKNILQTYKKQELIPGYIESNITDKNEEWKYHFYSEKDCLKYLKQEYGEEFCEKYNSFTKRSHKEDLFKLCWLYKNGGIYMNINMELVVSLNSITENIKNNFAIMHDDFRTKYYGDLIPPDIKNKYKSETLVNSFIVTNRGNETVKRCIQNLMKIDQEDLDYSYSLVLFIMQHSLVDVQNYQFFERSDDKFFPFSEGTMEIFDVKDKKIANSKYKNLEDGMFV